MAVDADAAVDVGADEDAAVDVDVDVGADEDADVSETLIVVGCPSRAGTRHRAAAQA
ncbi:hypothetical protein [Streptacidiphilus jiangxiensis]|uniref:Uncharacterized protein n=1 Tax=Streptacidiphilus jiangxiensis TaxID=235985 RepID=A0A1H7QYD9_STRJI|nr:hypothetical protein [Streptacidiphilus jiangxiensis]SEL52337.1 hypothetical protein SAMN05414137_109257 [Streptacidiphilus jiangxiensis]